MYCSHRVFPVGINKIIEKFSKRKYPVKESNTKPYARTIPAPLDVM